MSNLDNLIDHIEENTRSSSNAGLEFIDPRNYKKRLVNKQNHVVFGRRGSGKTTLMNSIDENQENILKVRINLENYKDFSFPNVLIKVLENFLNELEKNLKEEAGWNIKKRLEIRKTISQIKKEKKHIADKFIEQDEYEEEVTETSAEIDNLEAGNKKSPIKLSSESSETLEKQRKRNIQKSKIIKREIDDIKEIINSASDFLNKSIFLILDDFYFIKRQDQPSVADFFHLLTKDTRLFLKVASIKHRTDLYASTGESYYGMELGHDALEIDLDYTLDRFDDLKEFMKELLEQASEDTSANIEIDDILTPKGFNQLCLAAGGVPRDFLSLFVDVASKWNEGDTRISKPDVTGAAISKFPAKKRSFKKDSADEKERLENYLGYIESFCIENERTNIFLVSNERIDDYPEIEQAIRELMDLRMIHLVHPNTSCAPSDGKMYSAYMIDIGLYDNAKPRNFDQVDPGVKDEKSRKDEIRSSPKIKLENFNRSIN